MHDCASPIGPSRLEPSQLASAASRSPKTNAELDATRMLLLLTRLVPPRACDGGSLQRPSAGRRAALEGGRGEAAQSTSACSQAVGRWQRSQWSTHPRPTWLVVPSR